MWHGRYRRKHIGGLNSPPTIDRPYSLMSPAQRSWDAQNSTSQSRSTAEAREHVRQRVRASRRLALGEMGEVCTVTLGQSPDGTSHNVGRYSKPLLKRITAIYNEQMAAMELSRGAMEAPLDAAKACPDVRLRAVLAVSKRSSGSRGD